MGALKVETDLESMAVFKEQNFKITSLATNANNIIKACGIGSERSESAIEDALEQFEEIGERSESFSHVNASTLLHRTAQLASRRKRSGSLEQRFPTLLGHLVDVIYEWHRVFDPRHTASAIWSFGLLGRQMLMVNGDLASFPACFSALLEKAEAQAQSFSAQEVASILSGLSKLGLRKPTHEKLVSKLMHTTESKLETFQAQELSSIVWSLAKLKYKFRTHQKLLRQILKRFKAQMKACAVQDLQLANFMWGVTKLGYDDARLDFCSSVSAHLVKQLPFMRPQPLTTVIWALGKLRYLPSETHLQAIASSVSEKMQRFDPIHIAKVLHAFAGFGRSFDCLVTSTKTYLASNTFRFGSQELCNVLWSLAILEELDMITFEQSVEALKRHPKLSISRMKSSERRQLYTCLIHLHSFCNISSEHELLPPDWVLLCEEAYARGQKEKKTYSVALSVMLTLQKMGSACQNHSLHEQSSKVLDLVTTVDGVRVAIEVTIPTHYFVNSVHELKGPRLWAMKIMEAQGLVVLRVDCKNWNELGADARVAYVRKQLGLSSPATK